MWRHLLQRLGVAVHPALKRHAAPVKQVYGIFCDANSGGLDEGELLCAVPFFHCIAAKVAAASPWGSTLMANASSYTVSGDGVRVEYPSESVITTVFCALVLLFKECPLNSYLQWIELEHEDDASMQRKLGGPTYAKLQSIKVLNESIIVALCEDASSAGWNVSFDAMSRAHAICSSRCVDVPCSQDVFGGPALVPFVDLINHNEEDPNVVVYVDTIHSLLSLLRRSRHLPQVFEDEISGGHCPFYVIARAAKEIAAGEELHYRYLDPHDALARDPLFWASRFHFCP
ncbi:hypothetical protein TraAM80_09578 [Trypanosoma rangeli]|uniref:Uncharacterized protein n=1 Tax=Trypanosoma rangeli TaxID=5698 RepID=A0A3R7M657_TRYRA|nr:uncharacterized protein TraAM80_09578 [Trypanosoma rangeli]RNE96887.1 hypothetical protein TraAM80_09578 [Trypanosoma rangeli]|eukprot:RNE96887.1 hypothetical protein TraAM80_09578 [Trypanosoma rangeli]